MNLDLNLCCSGNKVDKILRMASNEEIILKVTELLDSSSSSEDFSILDSTSSSSSSSCSSPCDEDEARDSYFLDKITSLTNNEFKGHFRLTRASANILIDKYRSAQVAPKGEKGGREIIGEELEIYIFLWYIANTVTFRQIGNLFNVSKSSAWQVVKRVSSWLVDISREYIHWPTESEAATTTRIFENMKGIPGVIGAIDGTHVKIKAPSVNKIAYYNRKKYYSLAVQGIVDANKKFIDIHCGEPGSLHDSRILRRSDIFRAASINYDTLFRSQTFLIGDSAYPLLDWLIPPYKDNGSLNDMKVRFNSLHSSTRMVVENVFGLLKGRFRRLQFFTENIDLLLCSNIIISACVLHNICIDNNELEIEDDEYNIDLEDNVNNESNADDIDVTNSPPIRSRRQKLLEDLIDRGIL